MSGGPTRAAFNGQNLTVSLGTCTPSLHTCPLDMDCVPRAYTVTTSKGRCGQPFRVCSVLSPEPLPQASSPHRETQDHSANRWTLGLSLPQLTFFYDALSQARPCMLLYLRKS